MTVDANLLDHKKVEPPVMADAGMKKAKAEKPKGEKRTNEPAQMPFLLELTFSLSNVLLLLITLAVAGAAIFSGATWQEIVLRLGVTVLVMGTVLWMIVHQISTGMVKAVDAERKKDSAKDKEKKSNAGEEGTKARGV